MSDTWTTQWPWNHEPFPDCFHILIWKNCGQKCHKIKAGSLQPIIQPFYFWSKWLIHADATHWGEGRENKEWQNITSKPMMSKSVYSDLLLAMAKCLAASGLLFPSVCTFCFLYTVHMLSSKGVWAILWTALHCKEEECSCSWYNQRYCAELGEMDDIVAHRFLKEGAEPENICNHFTLQGHNIIRI